MLFDFLVLRTTWSKQRPVPAIAVHQQPYKDLIQPSSLEPVSGYVRCKGVGLGPTYNPDPTLTIITKNRARASVTNTWPWNVQVALGEWHAWIAATLPRVIRGRVWHTLVHQRISRKHSRRRHTPSKDQLMRQQSHTPDTLCLKNRAPNYHDERCCVGAMALWWWHTLLNK